LFVSLVLSLTYLISFQSYLVFVGNFVQLYSPASASRWASPEKSNYYLSGSGKIAGSTP
jgi:hypothetical protein